MFGGASGSQVTLATLATPGTTVGIIMVSACRGQLTPAGNVSLTLPEPFGTTGPSDGATGINASTTFAWTSFASAAYVLRITCPTNGVGACEGKVVTGPTNAKLVYESSLGITIPSGADCQNVGKIKAPRDRTRLSVGRRNPAYPQLIVEID